MEKVPENGSEHILVCLSSSPSNRRVITAAVKMAEAFHATLTAIYIKPTNYDSLSEKDKERLQNNILFAEQNGASVTTITGNDIPNQIAEFAHISGITKIVIGRSGDKRQHFRSISPLTEQIILKAPDVDVYIIPDSAADLKHQKKTIHRTDLMRPSVKDTVITVLLLLASTMLGLAFTQFGFSESNIITVFILGVLIISATTVSPVYGVIGSLASVLLFNYFFIEPRLSFHTYRPEYAVTFAIMLISSLITGSLANRLKWNARQAALEAFRAKVLFDTNQLLQRAETSDDVIRITGQQVIILLDRDIAIYPLAKDQKLGRKIHFVASHSEGSPTHSDADGIDADEKNIAEWVYQNQKTAGFSTDQFSGSNTLYHAISMNGYCYGVLGIYLEGKPLEALEHSVLISILGECALALENLRNASEKEQAAIIAHNEQTRANLLRSISHDIRTPLTSISGNASTLLSLDKQLDDETRKQIFSDIYDDSEWLIDLVENLLSISRIDNGRMQLHLSAENVNDVIEEALKHLDRNAVQHPISIRFSNDFLLVKIDARLITQVLINLVNNAVKNTPAGTEICVASCSEKNYAVISVCDSGPGIPDDVKPHIFEMFYTGQNKIADGRRGLGLGLALCKSIVEAHGGTISLTDNVPSGCRFTFTLPKEEVNVNEYANHPGSGR